MGRVAKEKSEKGEESRFGKFHHGLNLEKEGGGCSDRADAGE